MIDLLLTKKWQKLLIQGNLNSGKSELGLIITNHILLKSKDHLLDRLLNQREKVLLFTEQADEVQLIKQNLHDKIFVVEQISSKNYYDYLKNHYEWSSVDLLIIDYVNLLNDRSYLMKDLLQFITETQIRTIFIQNTFKPIKEHTNLSEKVDYILETSRNKNGFEVLVKKEEGQYLSFPKTFWIDSKD